MNKNHRALIAAALMAATPLTALAASIDEVEPNNSPAAPQQLKLVEAETVINGRITTVSDLDFYSFYASEGDVVTLDIDGTTPGLNTIIALFDENFIKRHENNTAPFFDEGSATKDDAYLDKVRIPKSGIYIVGVSSYPRFFRDGGTTTASNGYSRGAYKLVITGVSPPVQQINIEVKPGSGELAPMNPKSHGKVPVALLSDAKFDALTVNVDSLAFGSTGTEKSLAKCNTAGEDVNGDGRLDLVCHFDNEKLKLQSDDLEGILTGTYGPNKMAIEGHGLLKILPPSK